MSKLICRKKYIDVKQFLTEKAVAGRISDQSISRYRSYLKNSLVWAGGISFNQAHEINPGLVDFMCTTKSSRDHTLFSPETINKTINLTKNLFLWGKEKSIYGDLPLAWINSLYAPTDIMNSRKKIRAYICISRRGSEAHNCSNQE